MGDPARCLAKVVFELAGRPYTWLDVLLAADARADRPPFERAVLAGIAADDAEVAADEVDAALVAFRQRLDLTAAEDAERWLAGFDLDPGDWSDAIRRLLLRARRRETPIPVSPSEHVAPSSIPFEVWWADAVVSGVLAAWARRAAEDLVLAGARPSSPAEQADVAAVVLATPDAPRLASYPDAPARTAHFASVAAQARAVEEAAVTPRAIRATLGMHSLEWTVFAIERLSFPTEGAAREALLCHRLEGEPLADLAKRSGVPFHRLECRLEDLPPELELPCVGARLEEAVGPVAVEGSFSVLRVVRREPPSADQPASVERARAEIAERLRHRAVREHVRFLLPLEAP